MPVIGKKDRKIEVLFSKKGISSAIDLDYLEDVENIIEKLSEIKNDSKNELLNYLRRELQSNIWTYFSMEGLNKFRELIKKIKESNNAL